MACLLCPACLTTIAKLLAIAGVGLGAGLSEDQHSFLLAIALSVSLSASARRSWRGRHVWPLATACLGSLLVLSGHLFGESPLLEALGIATLLAGGLAEHFRLRRGADAARA